MEAFAIIAAATITAIASVVTGLAQRKNRQLVRDVQHKVKTRNGETLGEIVTEIYLRLRDIEERMKGMEGIQDDMLEGVGWMAVELGKHELRHARDSVDIPSSLKNLPS